MTWSGSNYLQSKYTYLHNLALTPYINSERFVLLTFELEFTVDSDTIASGGDLRLDVYRLSSLGLLTSKLASYYSGQNGLDELCLPTGRFQLAFLAYSDLCCASSKIQLSELQLTETECAPPTQTSYCEHSDYKIKPFSKYLINTFLNISVLCCFRRLVLNSVIESFFSKT